MTAPSRPPMDSEERVGEAVEWLDRVHAYLLYIRDNFVRKAPFAAISIDYEIRRTAEIRDAARAALGEARGTASASESLKSEQVALRASIDDQRCEIGGRCVWRPSIVAEHEVCAFCLRLRPTAPTAPLPSSETATPAPDLLRENARPLVTFDKIAADRMADEVATLVRRGIIDSRSPAADALLDYREPPSTLRADRLAELEAELTRARAAHLQNAELLAKANAEVERLKASCRNAGEKLNTAWRERDDAAALNTPLYRAAERWVILHAALRIAARKLVKALRGDGTVKNWTGSEHAALTALEDYMQSEDADPFLDKPLPGQPPVSDKPAFRQPMPRGHGFHDPGCAGLVGGCDGCGPEPKQ